MTGIDKVQQIVATIRAEMATRVAGTDGAARATPKRNVKSGAGSQQRMGKLISQRVKALEPDDPQRGKKAFRIFLESVLLNEFGEELINDHSFYQMVDAVEQSMEQDPQIALAVDKAVLGLLNQHLGRA